MKRDFLDWVGSIILSAWLGLAAWTFWKANEGGTFELVLASLATLAIMRRIWTAPTGLDIVVRVARKAE